MGIAEAILFVVIIIASLISIVTLFGVIVGFLIDIPNLTIHLFHDMFEMFHDIASYVKKKIKGKVEE